MAIDNTIAKLSKIQSELKAPKGQFNSFGNYKYRSCEDILEAVKPLLKGSIITISDEIVLVGDRFYVKATAKFEDETSQITNTAFAREPLMKKGMDESQITGATSSYARKYALNGLLAIDDTKDADTMDNTASTARDEAVVAPKTASANFSDISYGKCSRCGAPNTKSKTTGKIYCSKFCWNDKTISDAGLEKDLIY